MITPRDLTHAKRLIAQTDKMGERATTAEIERRNELQMCVDEVERCRRLVSDVKVALIASGWTDDALLRRVKEASQ